jgi:uncharacterized damage-inducible protein DinB
MRLPLLPPLLALMCLPAPAIAQRDPVSDAFRVIVKRVERRIIASAEAMPEAKYGYKPTAPQMTFAEAVVHVADGNDDLATVIGGVKAPPRTKLSPTDSKERLVARLKETFAWCDRTFATLHDRSLADTVDAGDAMETRAQAVMDAAGHWADHYSQLAIYLRLNGLLPPTATDPNM